MSWEEATESSVCSLMGSNRHGTQWVPEKPQGGDPSRRWGQTELGNSELQQECQPPISNPSMLCRSLPRAGSAGLLGTVEALEFLYLWSVSWVRLIGMGKESNSSRDGHPGQLATADKRGQCGVGTGPGVPRVTSVSAWGLPIHWRGLWASLIINNVLHF